MRRFKLIHHSSFINGRSLPVTANLPFMKYFVCFLLLWFFSVFLFNCTTPKPNYDASGAFETVETIVSAEAAGKILALNIEEGAQLAKDSVVGRIDPTNLTLQKEQASSSIAALRQKTNDPAPQIEVLQAQYQTQESQINVLNAQLAAAEKDRDRMHNLVDAKAAPAKQLDDLTAQTEVLNRQVAAAKSQLNIIQNQIKAQRQNVAIQNRAILSEQRPLQKGVNAIQNQIEKTQIVNPVAGTVLTKYAEAYEYTAPGKALYKVADLTTMILRAYVTEDQLLQIQLNQPVKVMIDSAAGKMKTMNGVVNWISDKSEFTPKTIQTKDERANLVYAMKIKVKNDGSLKIGMYGEVKFH